MIPRRGAGSRRAAAILLAAVAAGVALAVPPTSGGFSAQIKNSADTAGASSRFTCATTFATTANKTNAYFQYDLAGTGASASDSSDNANPGAYAPAGNHPTAAVVSTTACPNDAGLYYSPNGTSNFVSTSKLTPTAPMQFTLVVWFSTTKAGGYVIGLNSAQTCDGGRRDRHLYVDTAGKLEFGVYDNAVRVVKSSLAYDDGLWHQAVATLSPTTGLSLWADGQKVDSLPGTTRAEDYSGYWCIASGALAGWPNAPSNAYFQGGLRYAAAYTVALSDSEIAAQYANGRPGT